jgi:hypothetical protein
MDASTSQNYLNAAKYEYLDCSTHRFCFDSTLWLLEDLSEEILTTMVSLDSFTHPYSRCPAYRQWGRLGDHHLSYIGGSVFRRSFCRRKAISLVEKSCTSPSYRLSHLEHGERIEVAGEKVILYRSVSIRRNLVA